MTESQETPPAALARPEFAPLRLLLETAGRRALSQHESDQLAGIIASSLAQQAAAGATIPAGTAIDTGALDLRVGGVIVATPAIPWNDEVRDILGRPCFTLVRVANALRAKGMDIPPRAEDEQAEIAERHTQPAAVDAGLIKGATDAADYLARHPSEEYALRHFRERMAALTAALQPTSDGENKWLKSSLEQRATTAATLGSAS